MARSTRKTFPKALLTTTASAFIVKVGKRLQGTFKTYYYLRERCSRNFISVQNSAVCCGSGLEALSIALGSERKQNDNSYNSATNTAQSLLHPKYVARAAYKIQELFCLYICADF